MDNKNKLLILLIFIVIVLGIVFDINTRTKKLENKKNIALEQPETLTENNQEEDISNENDFEKDVQNSFQPDKYLDGEPKFDEVQIDAPPIVVKNKREYFEEEHAGKKPSPVFMIENINFIKPLDHVLSNSKCTDSYHNNYFFISRPYESTLSPQVMGLLVKTSQKNKILWQYQISSTYADPMQIKSLAYRNGQILLFISGDPKIIKPIIFSPVGSVISNPYAMKFGENFNKPANSFSFGTIKKLNILGTPLLAVSYIDKAYIQPNQSLLEEVLLYKQEKEQLVFVKKLYSRSIKTKQIDSNLKINSTFENDRLTIEINDPDNNSESAINKTEVTYKETLISDKSYKGSAPRIVKPGITILKTAYNIKIGEEK